ncbi:DUF2760 domain-containing protein [Massilia violaceinigra]|uniref:DUF2760 domain-containing protein n=1 Tax=Massilia violaceinigra TaxID=2045208 RepID=A0ABY4AD25_9BURK|nr:DUF2760 domain-containing protein [Massilia violaceinigra]UOD31869.1 DUF2760 domain-containing protein [Massilia violaceinigra]
MIDSSPNSNHPSHDNNPPSFLRRIPIAFGAFFGALSDGGFAGRIERVRDGMPVPPPAPVAPVAAAPAPAPVPAPKPPAAPTPDTALQLLSLLQRDARLIDFTQENLSGFSDADIGAAARVVHEGCAKVLREHFTIVPVRDEAEGSRVTLNEGFDARAVRLTGNVVGKAPFNGSISHRGWRAADVRLPTLAAGHDATVLAQAEVEL